jgi:hypothetical protein
LQGSASYTTAAPISLLYIRKYIGGLRGLTGHNDIKAKRGTGASPLVSSPVAATAALGVSSLANWFHFPHYHIIASCFNQICYMPAFFMSALCGECIRIDSGNALATLATGPFLEHKRALADKPFGRFRAFVQRVIICHDATCKYAPLSLALIGHIRA